MRSEFFQNIMQWNFERNGTTVQLPFFYYDSLSMAAVYTASTREVRRLLPHPALHPIELIPGRCLVAFACFEYRECDGVPYNEVNISFLASYKQKPLPLLTLTRALRTRTIPSYVWQLPVTEEVHRAGGVDLFGYPKFLADIQFMKSKERIECKLSVPGADILRLSGRNLPTKPGGRTRYITYAMDNGALLRADDVVNPLEYAESRRREDVELEIGGNHAICRSLRDIELGKAPVVYQFSPRNEAILFPARNVDG